MANKVKIVLSEKPVKYSNCPFSDYCGWACNVNPGADDECRAFDDFGSDSPKKFNFSKCPHCISITDIIKH